ncbi:hypothetical protein G6F57_016705 [Rhizopus arrhizus]|uniref:Transposase Tc1-like domain-containing protein n=1 Tax=Rhizopus oryzae TaxID=64495 RepID=A0A9P6WWM1_RHIOR|nr:hypothetical protein G6F21_014045 [Rhizopus arrhizus]KAG0813524.1 hypothetical protein G6F18_013298 [Rhizopus arrhizus]KAG0817671.1 hypothetical protein G6F19_012766 [Rhizopus arrhizus]KAG0858740.1 hypothetical protein G6F16_013387 [Rhizopus arrhizus]KAG0866028.1 hypothetical protein G6F15_012771 [Rhizopus arrhizus]
MKAAPGRRATIGETTKHTSVDKAKIKAKKPLLSKQHKERRLAWAMAHKDWTTDDWRRMVFSDETKLKEAKEVSWYGVVLLMMALGMLVGYMMEL